MSAVESMSEAEELRRFIPLNSMPASRFEQLYSEVRIEEAPRGTVLFHQGDATNEFVYLLSGTISLQAGGVEMDSVSGGTDVARFALAHQNPRKVSAVAKDQVRYVRINPYLIYPRKEERSAASDARAGDSSEEDSSEKSGDWMSALIRSPIFQRLPPANLQVVLRGLEEIEVNAGDVIYCQDSPADYFYIIKSGQCALTRKPTPTAREVKLATFKSWETFGEDALISEKPHSVTVTMETDGQLLRLDKASFLKLVRDPIISRLTAKEAIQMLKDKGVWLDVRLPDQYQQGHPRGPSINAPFFSLRMALSTLDRNKKYITVCEDGKVSEAAAYLLLRFRFDAHVLKGGIGTLPPEEITTNPATSSPEAESKTETHSETPEPEAAAQNAQCTEDGAANPSPGPVFNKENSAEPERMHLPRDDRKLQELESRLSRLTNEKEQSDAELRQARQAVHRLETDLSALRQEHERLLQEQARSAVAPEPEDQDLRQELEDLKSRYAEIQFEKESAEQEVENLEQQVDELKAMLEELRGRDEPPADEDTEALRSELEMVRNQADAELSVLQTRLKEVEAEKSRLGAELQSVKTQMAVREAAATAASLDSVSAKRSLASRILGPLVVGLLFTALILGGLFGLPAGRDFMRARLNGPVQTEPVPAEPATAIPAESAPVETVPAAPTEPAQR
jgi:CRP-like cAMP-binding protein/predicted  nucleic acid-binding Zn-ribbon protein